MRRRRGPGWEGRAGGNRAQAHAWRHDRVGHQRGPRGGGPQSASPGPLRGTPGQSLATALERALAGDLRLAALDVDERAVANAELDVNIAGSAARTSYADQLAREGVTTISIDSDGRFVERRPDGTTTVL